MKRGRARSCIETVWTCPKCGKESSQWRKPSSFGKTLATYCGPCRRTYFVLLETSHVKGKPIVITYRYNLRFSVRLDRAIPKIREVTDGINASLAEFGYAEKLQIRSHLFSFDLRCKNPLADQQVNEAQAEILMKLHQQLPDLDVLPEGWILIYEHDRTEEPAKSS